MYVWQLVKEESPCTVVSIRAPDMHFGQVAPKIGSRLLIQALVKFDTLQVGPTFQVCEDKLTPARYRLLGYTTKKVSWSGETRSLDVL